jgi:hypothetical protein
MELLATRKGYDKTRQEASPVHTNYVLNMALVPDAVFYLRISSPQAQFNRSLAVMSVAERKNKVSLSTQRAEIIVAGGLVLEGVMRALKIESLQTCEWALREGVLIDRLRDWGERI